MKKLNSLKPATRGYIVFGGLMSIIAVWTFIRLVAGDFDPAFQNNVAHGDAGQLTLTVIQVAVFVVAMVAFIRLQIVEQRHAARSQARREAIAE